MGDIRDMIESRGEANDMNAMGCHIFTSQPVSYAMAYVPFQSWRRVYDPTVALERGTIFPELDKPFIGEEAVSRER